jgi:hypothetical protein
VLLSNISYFGALLVLSTVEYEFEAKNIRLLLGKFRKLSKLFLTVLLLSLPKYEMLGRWNASKAIIYKLPVNSNFKYTIEIEKADFDTYLYIYDEKGNEINQNDDSGVGLKSKLSSLSFNSHREAYIVVSGFNNKHGNFTLKVEREYSIQRK